jgi:hypothetical protein
MFPTDKNEAAESLGQYLGEQLRDRLRVALDFATLGAYELSGVDEDPDVAPVPRERERPQRVFLFAKVAPSCPASREAEGPRCAVDNGARRRAKDRPGRRRGGVRAPEQPCVCAIKEKARA